MYMFVCLSYYTHLYPQSYMYTHVNTCIQSYTRIRTYIHAHIYIHMKTRSETFLIFKFQNKFRDQRSGETETAMEILALVTREHRNADGV
jgi:hypothetical protein